MVKIISLLPDLPDGVNSRPLFATDEEYQDFRQRYIETMAPELEKWRRAHLESEKASMSRRVD